MSLFIEVESAKLDTVTANNIVSGADAERMLRIEVVRHRRLLRSTKICLVISEERGVANSMLSDNADWNSDTWDFLPSVAARFIATIRYIITQLPDGFSISFLWAGEVVKHTKKVTVDDLVSIIQDNRIGTSTCYEVSWL